MFNKMLCAWKQNKMPSSIQTQGQKQENCLMFLYASQTLNITYTRDYHHEVDWCKVTSRLVCSFHFMQMQTFTTSLCEICLAHLIHLVVIFYNLRVLLRFWQVVFVICDLKYSCENDKTHLKHGSVSLSGVARVVPLYLYRAYNITTV